jgi:3-dehydroquinate dehydratase-2
LKILVVNGPNLNLLGIREPETYGKTTLADIEASLRELAATLTKGSQLTLQFKQSNIEGEIVNFIQETLKDGTDAVLINPGAYGHTSIAIRDAFLATAKPFVEVHLSNVYSREPFRQKSYLSDIARGVIAGFGSTSYELGLRALVGILEKEGL